MGRWGAHPLHPPPRSAAVYRNTEQITSTSPVAVGTEDRPEKDDDPILDLLSHSLSSLSGGFWENLVTKLKPNSENALFIVRGSFLACFLTVL